MVELCIENKQSVPASSSSYSDDSASVSARSPGVSSPATNSSYRRRTTGPVRRVKGGWTPQEDDLLRHAVAEFKGKSWKKIGSHPFSDFAYFTLDWLNHLSGIVALNGAMNIHCVTDMWYYVTSYGLLYGSTFRPPSVAKILLLFTDDVSGCFHHAI
ncbi:unnamed protein product [Rhodiola kirilowii]